MKYLIYARVSPRGNQDKETSISMQIDMCKEYIRDNDGEVVKVLSDEFFSGKNTDRPAVKELLHELESGQAEWDAICVYKLSRLTRSLKDGAIIFEKLYQYAKGFVSITEKNLDFSTPSGRAMLGILQVFNQFEREQTAENTLNKMISIASKGLWPVGKPPFGYCRHEKGDNKLYIDPRKSEIVKDIYAMYLSDHQTTKDIAKKYRNHLSKQQILNILRNKAYIGMICYAGEIYPGKHKALIDDDTFKQVQVKLPQKKRHSRPKSQRYPYILSGLVKCHCGRYMTPASAKSGQYHYYRCTDNITCKNRVTAHKLEEKALEYAKNIKIEPEFIQATLKRIEKRRDNYVKAKRPELANAQKALAAATKEREKTFKAIIADKVTDSNVTFFNKRLTEILKEIERLNVRIEYLKEQCNVDDEVFDFAQNTLKQIMHFSEVLKVTPDDPNAQRQVLLTNIKTIQENDAGDFVFEFNFGTSKEKEWLRRLDSNQGPSG